MSDPIGHLAGYSLHLLGWKSFQDLAIAVAEECLRRPVQTFLPTNDAGRDGGFVGRWDGDDPAAGESTIQCKFTSKPYFNLTLSILEDELKKVSALSAKGLAHDYIILTNHPVTGASDIAIREAFQDAGAGRCRVFGRDWIVRQIKSSPRLRIMAPRLYGLGDLSELMDARAYAQAQLILSAMGDDIQRLVVTEAHRRSVRAISEHNVVLLLGAPAAGKSTIGASIAVGAADIWQSATIRATSPEDIQSHLDPEQRQFFWIDDAWGSTQYQRQTAERWNQTFPLMQGAIHRGTRFLITSRDYIWKSAQLDLKLQAMPALRRSQVIINVEELTTQERAQILYNHVKLGDQPHSFRKIIKRHLPEIAAREDFLPETARRLGTRFFSTSIDTSRDGLVTFFAKPQEFLLDTITNLSDACRAAIAVVFLSGGTVRSPVSSEDIAPAAAAFGVSEANIRQELEFMNGSLLLLVQDEHGLLWTYRHPTVSDAFSRYVAASPEKIEIYLRGARLDSLLREVVCAGAAIQGHPVIIPESLLPLLLERIRHAEASALRTFISYRSSTSFSAMLLAERPELVDVHFYYTPLSDDPNGSFVGNLHAQGLLPDAIRLRFVQSAREAAEDNSDSSFFDAYLLQDMLTDEEKEEIVSWMRERFQHDGIRKLVGDYRANWDSDYPPEEYFGDFARSVERYIELALPQDEQVAMRERLQQEIRREVETLDMNYEPPSSTSAPTTQSPSANAGLNNLFRDVDD